MKKLFKNIANTAKTTAANCKTSIATFHSRAISNNAGEGRRPGRPGAGRSVCCAQ